MTKSTIYLALWAIFTFFYGQNALAQSICTAPFTIADVCEDACFIINSNPILVNNIGLTGQGETYCNGDLIDNNGGWFQFIAASTDVSIGVSALGCTGGNGIKIALFNGCNGSLIACDASGNATGRTIIASSVPGEMYHLLIAGDVCTEIVIEVVGADTPAMMGSIGAISGLSVACPGAVTNYSVPIVTNAIHYKWTAPVGASINNSGLNVLEVPANLGGNQVEIWFSTGSTGAAQVKAQAFGVLNQSTATVAKTVSIQAIPPTQLPPLIISQNDLPYNWVAMNQTISNTGIYQASEYYASWLGCDSLVMQILQVLPLVQGTVFWDINGNGAYNQGTDIPAENVVLNANNLTASTDPDGHYSFSNVMPIGTLFGPNPLPQYALGSTPPFKTYSFGLTIPANFALNPVKETVTGLVYFDTNNNGLLETNIDQPINTVVIRTTSGRVAQVNNGQYFFADLAYPERIFLDTNNGYSIVGPSSLPFTPGINTGYNFLLKNNIAFGYVFWDTNMDGLITPGEPVASNIELKSGTTTLTNANGFYQFSAANAGDTVTVTALSITATPPFQVFMANNTLGHNFVVKPATTTDLAIELTNNTVFRPGFSTKVFVNVANGAAFAAQAKVGIKKPAFLQLLTAQPNVTVLGDSLVWYLGDLPPNATRQLVLTFKTTNSTAIGTSVLVSGKVSTLFGDSSMANNTDAVQAIVVGSYDPNDKQVEPMAATLAQLQANQPLTYTIRFQNTGNFPADFVELVDTLSGALQWSTMRILASSHPCTYTLQQGVLKFFFDDILLPGAAQDEPNSHGFVKFSVQPIGGLTVGDQVANFCDIYFDYNPPIRTNTATTEVVLFGQGGNPPAETATLSVRPNPASYTMRLSWPEALPNDGILRLYRDNGTTALTEVVAAGSTGTQINTSWLNDGYYTLVLSAGTRMYVRRVAIVQDGGIRKRE